MQQIKIFEGDNHTNVIAKINKWITPDIKVIQISPIANPGSYVYVYVLYEKIEQTKGMLLS